MFWALLPPMAAAPKRSPSKRSESWLVPFRWWMGRDKCREALAAVPDDEISKLSELGRQLRREARHRRFDAVRARPFRLFPRAAAATPSYPAEPGMLRRLLGDVIESRRRRAEREVARYLARLD